jgi:hypothetical protein
MSGRITRCALAVLCASARLASADHKHAIDLVESDGGCPTNEAFADALRSIFPDVAIRGETGGDLRVELVGSRDHYRVVAGTAEREFEDPAMRCDERARNAAVFVALVLEPPFVEAPAVTPEPAEPHSWSLGLELAGLAEVAPGGADRLTMTGGQLEVVGGGERLAAIVGAELLPSTAMMLDGVRAELRRVPIYLGARGLVRGGDLGAWGEAAVAATIQVTRGLDTASSVTATRMSVGGRLGVGLQYRGWDHAIPFVSIHAELIPETYNLTWPGAGVVGTTPHVWLGAVVGVAVPIL